MTVLESTAPATTSTPTEVASADPEPAEPGPEVVAGDDWRDVTNNLVGLESECGNVSFVSAHPAADRVIAGIALQGLWELAAGTEIWGVSGQPPTRM